MRTIFIALALMLLAGAAHASPATTISFDNLPLNVPIDTYEEGGFIVTATSVDARTVTWKSLDVGNPAPAIAAYPDCWADFSCVSASIEAAVTITAGGSLFTFSSIDMYKSFNRPSGLVFESYLNGTLVASRTICPPQASGDCAFGGGVYRSFGSGNPDVLQDALRITITNEFIGGPVGLDNLVVTRVPEPGTLALLGLGLAGLAATRRRKQ